MQKELAASEVGAAAAFLLSPLASAITGSVMCVVMSSRVSRARVRVCVRGDSMHKDHQPSLVHALPGLFRDARAASIPPTQLICANTLNTCAHTRTHTHTHSYVDNGLNAMALAVDSQALVHEDANVPA